MFTIPELYDLKHSLAGAYLAGYQYPWEAVAGIRALIETLGQELPEEYVQAQPRIWIHRTAQVAESARIEAPCILGAGTQVRHGAFLRGAVLTGEGCVIGNSVEVKNAILFDGVQVPHFNYVGDSILGYKAHLGAGAVTSNVRADKMPVVVHGQTDFATGLKKLGALLGDFTEVGCNAVLNPGTVLGRNSVVYPLSCVRGVVPAGHIFKNSGQIVLRQ